MSKNAGAEIMYRALDFLNNIEKSNPAPISRFAALVLTGDQTADNVLSGLSLIMLQQFKNDGMINADDLSKSDAKIYGLTEQGKKMRSLFLKLVHA